MWRSAIINKRNYPTGGATDVLFTDQAPPSYAEVIASTYVEASHQEIGIFDSDITCPQVISRDVCGFRPTDGLCPACMSNITTKFSYKSGRISYYPAGMLPVFCVMLPCWANLGVFVCCIASSHDVRHMCPKCGVKIHTYERNIVEKELGMCG